MVFSEFLQAFCLIKFASEYASCASACLPSPKTTEHLHEATLALMSREANESKQRLPAATSKASSGSRGGPRLGKWLGEDIYCFLVAWGWISWAFCLEKLPKTLENGRKLMVGFVSLS